jgi:2-polyprenyl-3-methyl-5-hydroxy-6-metoxy-1,4-benzoquinol methylase
MNLICKILFLYDFIVCGVCKVKRVDQILKYVSKADKGIEVAPWHSPIAPKKDGYNVRTLDLFDTETLIQKCKQDKSVEKLYDSIESVDFVCSALDIEDVVRASGQISSFDYIISSHNFEHLPDPIRFLRSCGEVLAKGGMLSMAIPDKRRTFDYVRSLSRTSDMLQYYFEERKAASVYDLYDNASKQLLPTEGSKSLPIGTLQWANRLEDCYENLKNSVNTDFQFADAHVTVFTPDSFRAIMLELIRLDLVPFQIVEITDSPWHEFYVHLKNVGYGHESRKFITDQVLLDAYQVAFKDNIKINYAKVIVKRLWRKIKKSFKRKL